MKVQEKLTYTNERGESVVFSPASSYHVNFKDVSGLSDVQNAIYSTNSMGQDGDTYLGYRIESRDIDIVGHIKERDKIAIQELRRNLNRILNPQYSATLTYELGDFKRVIGCTINNAPIFKRGTIFEQFTIQLSCLNPFWREEAETREDIATWIGGFEFPVPDGLEITPDWEIGYRQPSLIVNVFNSGDVKSGIRIEFRALGALTNPQLLNVNTKEFIKANISLEAGDVLTVSTGYGEKSVKLTRNGAESDAFRYLDVDSSYLQLAVGDNLFRYSADTNAENLEVSSEEGNARSKGGGRKYRRPSCNVLQGADRAGSRGGNGSDYRRNDPAIGGSDRLSGIRGRARLQHRGRNHQVQRALLRDYRAAHVERCFLSRRNDLRILPPCGAYAHGDD